MAEQVRQQAIIIREAEAHDLPRLLAIERASFSDPWTKRHLAEDNCLVAIKNEEVVAFLIWREICPASDQGPAEFEILNLAVDPRWRRRGIASRLLEQLVERKGVYFLEVRESNSAGQSLYSQFGFQAVGKRPQYYRRPTESAIVMRMKRC